MASYPTKGKDYTIAQDVNPYLWCQQVYEGTGDAKTKIATLSANAKSNIDSSRFSLL